MRSRSSLFTRLLILLAGLGTGFLVLTWRLYRSTENIFYGELQSELRGDAEWLSHLTASDPGLLRFPRSDSLAKAVSQFKGYRVTLIAPDGHLLGDSHVPKDSLPYTENHSSRPEVLAAHKDGFGTSRRFSHTVGVEMLYVAKALSPNGAVVRMAAGSATLEHFRRAALRMSLMALLLFCLVAAVIAFWISRWISRPLLHLRDEARDVSKPLRWEAPFREAEILNQAFAEYAGAVGRLSSGLEQERDRLRAVLDRLEEGVLLLDGRGIVRAANPSALRLLPLRPDSAPLERKPFATAVAHEGLCQWVADSNPKRLPVLQVDKGPENPFDLLCHLRPLQPNEPNGETLLTVMDVTRFRNLDRAKTDFVANASHELKTPLSSILGYTEALFDGALENPKMLEHFLRKVQDNALRLQTLVKDLLSLSQLENQEGPARAEPLPVRGFAQAAWNQHRVEAERNGVRFENRVPENLIWNMEPRDLDLLLGNLVGNAVRYNTPGGKVQMEWDEGSRVLGVRDTGHGIPPEMLPHIFERFYRGDPARARGDGTGLGLAIVKHAVQRYGIQVSAESTIGEGSRFCLEIPEERIGIPV